MKSKLITMVLLAFFSIQLIAQSNYDRALKYIEENKYDEAFQIAKQLFDTDSISESLKLAIALRESGYLTTPLYELLGDIYADQTVKELALENYLSAENKDSTNIALKFKIADFYFENKEYKDAANEYLKVIQIDSSNVEAYKKISNIFYAAKMYADASIYLQKAISLSGEKQLYLEFIKSNIQLNNYSTALEYSKQALRKYPQDEILLMDLAECYYFNSEYDSCLAIYLKTDVTHLKSPELFKAAKSAQQLNKDTTAIYYYNKIKADSALFTKFRLDLANLYFKNNMYDEAEQLYLEEILVNPNNEFAHRFLGFSYFQKKQYLYAKDEFKTALVLNDTNVDSYFWLAQSYKCLDSVNAAAKTFEDLLEATKGNSEKYSNQISEACGFLGYVSYNNKNYPSAISYLRRAVAISPNVLTFNVLLASSLHSNGNVDDAIKVYKKILLMDPNNEVAKKGLRMLSAD